MTGSGRETLPDVRESLPDVQEWSGGPPECPGVVGMPTRMTGSGRQTLLDVREVHRNVWEVLLNVWEWSGVPPG